MYLSRDDCSTNLLARMTLYCLALSYALNKQRLERGFCPLNQLLPGIYIVTSTYMILSQKCCVAATVLHDCMGPGGLSVLAPIINWTSNEIIVC